MNKKLQKTVIEAYEAMQEALRLENEELNKKFHNLNSDLNGFLANGHLAVVIIDNELKIKKVSPNSEIILDISQGDLGKSLRDTKLNLAIPDIESILSSAVNLDVKNEIEVCNNKNCWFRVIIKPIKVSKENFDGFIISFIDIDAMKNYTEDLKKSNEQIKNSYDDTIALINSLPLPLLILDSDCNITFANHKFCEKFKYAQSLVKNKKIWEIDSGSWDSLGLRGLIEKSISKNEAFENIKFTSTFGNLGRLSFLLSCRAVKLPGSGQWRGLLVFEDVTDRMLAAKELKESEEKYRNLIRTARDGIIIVDEQGRIEFSNAKMNDLFGYKAGELLNKTTEYLVPDRFKSIHTQERSYFFSERFRNEKVSYSKVLQGKRKDGSDIPVEVTLSQFSSRNKTFVTAFFRDISERKEIEKIKKSLLVQERRANLAKDEFLAILSHELRTPLTSILSWAQTLNRGILDAEKQKRGFKIIEQCAKTQSQIIEDLLDISRIHADKLTLKIDKINPNEVITAAIEFTKSMVADKEIKLDVYIDPNIEFFIGDMIRLQQILWNLITNAVKFSKRGGLVRVTVMKVITNRVEYIEFKVKDEGVGINPVFLPIIFNRFTQADSTSTRSHGGLGLGLAIVKKLTELHSGFVQVESLGLGKGSTFTVVIPLNYSLLDKIDTSVEMLNIQKKFQADQFKDVKLLIVDDDTSTGEVFSLNFKCHGALVKTAKSASEAIEILKNFLPDVIISDISMPGEDGYSLIKKIRNLTGDYKDIPAVALTAYASSEDIERCMKAGFQKHVPKPVDMELLFSAIFNLIER